MPSRATVLRWRLLGGRCELGVTETMTAFPAMADMLERAATIISGYLDQTLEDEGIAEAWEREWRGEEDGKS